MQEKNGLQLNESFSLMRTHSERNCIIKENMEIRRHNVQTHYWNFFTFSSRKLYAVELNHFIRFIHSRLPSYIPSPNVVSIYPRFAFEKVFFICHFYIFLCTLFPMIAMEERETHCARSWLCRANNRKSSIGRIYILKFPFCISRLAVN